MSFLGSIITLLDARMTEPAMFGWFHLLFIALTMLCAVFLCKKFKNPSQKTVSKILLSFALISIFLEIYKQFNYTFSYDGNIVTADYQWYAFPFQFCSTPMYVALLAVIIKKEKIHNALCAYLATFSTFAGICVFAYPEQVFIDTIGINIQTMICHGGMIAIGVWLLTCGYIKLQHKTIVPASVTFAIMVVLASVMNEIAKLTGGNGGGKPDSAMGGGKDASKVFDALASVKDFSFTPMIACFLVFLLNDLYAFSSWNQRETEQHTHIH